MFTLPQFMHVFVKIKTCILIKVPFGIQSDVALYMPSRGGSSFLIEYRTGNHHQQSMHWEEAMKCVDSEMASDYIE